ncbi:MAG: hypothetical protein WAN86_21005 [Hyphomicrobiaceae bacterium]
MHADGRQPQPGGAPASAGAQGLTPTLRRGSLLAALVVLLLAAALSAVAVALLR